MGIYWVTGDTPPTLRSRSPAASRCRSETGCASTAAARISLGWFSSDLTLELTLRRAVPRLVPDAEPPPGRHRRHLRPQVLA